MLTKDFLRLRSYARRAGRRLEVLGRVNAPGGCYLLSDPQRKDGREVFCTSHDDAVAIQCLLAHAEDFHTRIKRHTVGHGVSLPPRLKNRRRPKRATSGVVLRGVK